LPNDYRHKKCESLTGGQFTIEKGTVSLSPTACAEFCALILSAELTPATWGHPKTAEVQQYRHAYG